MPLQYAGPKPLISAHGVEFDQNKEDKFVYLGFVAELIRALDHEYIEDKSYAVTTTYSIESAQSILSLIQKYNPLLDQEIAERENSTQFEIEDELKRAQENQLLCEEEREVLIKNIELLRNYRIRRAVNKTVYYSAITILAHIIQKGHISYITAPMHPIHRHVFHSIQGALLKLHPRVGSNIDIFEDKGHLSVRLEINPL
jgi:predicted DNA-binding transcriptional regulator